MEVNKKKGYYTKHDDLGKVDHLRIKDYSKNQVYTPVPERNFEEKILNEVLGDNAVKKEKKVDIYKAYGFLNAFGNLPDFGYIVYELNNRLYIENQDGKGFVEGFLLLNKEEGEKTIKFDDVKIYNKQFLDDSYIGKEATDLFILEDGSIYADRISGFRELIGTTYRLANPSIMGKVLVKR